SFRARRADAHLRYRNGFCRCRHEDQQRLGAGGEGRAAGTAGERGQPGRLIRPEMSFPLPPPMRRALDLAAEAAAADEVPVGAVVTRGDEIVAETRNAMRGSNDPT